MLEAPPNSTIPNSKFLPSDLQFPLPTYIPSHKTRTAYSNATNPPYMRTTSTDSQQTSSAHHQLQQAETKSHESCIISEPIESTPEPIFVPLPDPNNIEDVLSAQLLWNSSYKCSNPILTPSLVGASSSSLLSNCSSDTSSENDFDNIGYSPFENQAVYLNSFLPFVNWMPHANRESSQYDYDYPPCFIGENNYPPYFVADDEYTPCYIREDGTFTPLVSTQNAFIFPTHTDLNPDTTTISRAPSTVSSDLEEKSEETSSQTSSEPEKINVPSEKTFTNSFQKHYRPRPRHRRDPNIFYARCFGDSRGFDPNNPPRPYEKYPVYIDEDDNYVRKDGRQRSNECKRGDPQGQQINRLLRGFNFKTKPLRKNFKKQTIFDKRIHVVSSSRHQELFSNNRIKCSCCNGINETSNERFKPNFYSQSIKNFLQMLPEKELRGEYRWDLGEYIHYVPKLFHRMEPGFLHYMKFPNTSRYESAIQHQLKVVSASFGEPHWDLNWKRVETHGNVCEHNLAIRKVVEEELLKIFSKDSNIFTLIFRYSGYASQKDISPHMLNVLSAMCKANVNHQITVIISPFTFHAFHWKVL